MKHIYSNHWPDYELIDAGNNKKLERWGTIITIRPDRNAYFKPVMHYQNWIKKAHYEFVEFTHNSGEWNSLKNNFPVYKNDQMASWKISYKNCTFNLKLTKFKHIGLFPEQQNNWDFIAQNVKKNDKILNLFAYTGAASMIANEKGANVYHCDSIKQVLSWAKNNMESSKQDNIHWVLDDALKFAMKEAKRGKLYDGIIMDPPTFGFGTNKERWKIELKFPELVKVASKILNKNSFLIINTYSPKLKEELIKRVITDHFPNKTIEINKLAMKSTTGKLLEYGELTRVY